MFDFTFWAMAYGNGWVSAERLSLAVQIGDITEEQRQFIIGSGA